MEKSSRSIQVKYLPKAIQCTFESPATSSEAFKDGEDVPPAPALIFTHGAKGKLTSDAMVNFSSGFSVLLPILSFQGNMNLKSRVKMFNAVMEYHICSCTGGRSMGARAAVMTATKKTLHLVLVSYPLHAGDQMRDQILLDLPSSIKVVFMIGERDSMCNLEKLEAVRDEMKCKTWRVVVKNADHGMNVKPKVATTKVGKLCGNIAAKWLSNCDDEEHSEGVLSWDDETQTAEWSGWTSTMGTIIPTTSKKALTEATKSPVRTQKSKRNGETLRRDGDTGLISKRTRKRVKI
ncbi:hypothetical protein MMC14_009522 [Varicellaria rhodocarpa]|nr:hypothetical protein [Varicellaria rhodocarpa]